MIEKDFLENWIKILNYNSNFAIFQEERRLSEKARIPLTPVEINLNTLYYYTSYFYPLLISDQQNVLDVLLSNTGDKIESVILYKTTIAGIHVEYRKLKENIILYQKSDLEKLDVLFNKFQMNIEGDHKVRISTIRILKFEGLKLINQQAKMVKNQNFYESFLGLLNLIQRLFQEDLLIFYPEPNIVKLVKESKSILGNIKYSSIFNLIYQIIPKRKFNAIIYSDGITPLFKLDLIDPSLIKRKRFLKLQIEYYSELIQNNSDLKPNFLQNLKLEKNRVLYTISLGSLSSLFQEIIEMPVPPSKEKLSLIFQKFLYGMKNYGRLWNIYPKPKIYKTLPRFLLRLIGINLNFRKISYWAIPEFLVNIFGIVLGVKSNTLLLITQNIEICDKKSDGALLLERNILYSILIEVENGRIEKVKALDLKTVISDKARKYDLREIKSIASNDSQLIDTAILIDKEFITRFIESYFLEFYRLNFRTKLKTLKMMKDCQKFDAYPRNLLVKYIKKKSTLSLIRRFLPILIDKYEF